MEDNSTVEIMELLRNLLESRGWITIYMFNSRIGFNRHGWGLSMEIHLSEVIIQQWDHIFPYTNMAFDLHHSSETERLQDVISRINQWIERENARRFSRH